MSDAEHFRCWDHLNNPDGVEEHMVMETETYNADDAAAEFAEWAHGSDSEYFAESGVVAVSAQLDDGTWGKPFLYDIKVEYEPRWRATEQD